MVKIGIIGCGIIAQIMHLPYLTGTEGGGVPGAEVVAVCDSSKEVAEEMARRYHIKEVYSDYKEMLAKSDIDAVFVLTPHELHAKQSIDAMNAGKHVFVEKPLCVSVKDSERIIEAQKRNNVILQVGYMKRYDPAYLIAINEFKKMRDIKFIRVHNICSHHRERFEVCRIFRGAQKTILKKEPEKTSPLKSVILPSTLPIMREEHDHQIFEQFGQVTPEEYVAYWYLIAVTSHDINALRGIFGDPKRVLRTEIWSNGSFVVSLLDYGYAKCVFEFGRTNHKWWDEEITAYSDEKNVSVIFPSPFLKNAPTIVRVIEGSEITVETTIKDAYEEAFRRELDHFVKCIEKNEKPLTDAEDAKRDLIILSSIIENYRNKEPIELRF
jgi:predicted dehydrogenase